MIGSPSFNAALYGNEFEKIESFIGVSGTSGKLRRAAKEILTHNLLDASKCKCPLLSFVFPTPREKQMLGSSEGFDSGKDGNKTQKDI